MAAKSLIDLWSIDTFDDELLRNLRAHCHLVKRYFRTSMRIRNDRNASDHRAVPVSNPYSEQFYQFLENVGRELESRTIRAWHYTRLTDSEVQDIRANGISVSTIATLKTRLRNRVAAGDLTVGMAAELYSNSPFHSNQHDARSGRFWTSSDPIQHDDTGVERLLTVWGGEVASFFLDDETVLQALAKIGTPRIFEVAVPLKLTGRVSYVASSLMSTFARSIGAPGDFGGCSVCIYKDVDRNAILKVNTEGDELYSRVGSSYPAKFSSN